MSQNCKKDCHQKTVYYTQSSILVQRHAKGWCILCYCTSQWSIGTTYGWKESMEHRRWHNQQQAVFKPSDRVWVKTPHGRCTTKYKVGRVTGITNVQNITVDGMPRHVKRFVTIRERPCEQTPSTNAGDASSNNTSNEDQVTILPWRSTQRKRPLPECFMCDHRIRGECSSNTTNNLTSKKQKVCSLCYWHAETRRRKGRKRCDLFYGGEQDKPTLSGEIWWT